MKPIPKAIGGMHTPPTAQPEETGPRGRRSPEARTYPYWTGPVYPEIPTMPLVLSASQSAESAGLAHAEARAFLLHESANRRQLTDFPTGADARVRNGRVDGSVDERNVD